jgi:hypothetical protein
MDMGMVLQLSPPGVQNSGKTRQIGTDMARIPGQFFDGAGCRRKQRTIGKTLMAAAERPDLLRHGEGEHEVLTGQTAAELASQPIPAFVVLALGTMTVAAGSVDMMQPAAPLAAIDGDAEIAGTTVDDGVDHFLVLIRQVGKPLPVFRGKGSEDTGDGSHGHTSRITELMI